MSENRSFVMKRPCPGCPFGYHKEAVLHLREERLRGIVDEEGVFPCHMTVEDTGAAEGTERKACAGWLLYQLKNGPGQATQVMGRLGMIDEAALEKCRDETVLDWEELLERHT